MSGVAEVLRDVQRALRDPALSQQESDAVACLMILERCSYTDARAALARFCVYNARLSESDSYVAVSLLRSYLKQVRREQVKVKVSHPMWGPSTNVIHCHFDKVTNRALSDDGYLGARVLGEKLKKLEEFGRRIPGVELPLRFVDPLNVFDLGRVMAPPPKKPRKKPRKAKGNG